AVHGFLSRVPTARGRSADRARYEANPMPLENWRLPRAAYPPSPLYLRCQTTASPFRSGGGVPSGRDRDSAGGTRPFLEIHPPRWRVPETSTKFQKPKAPPIQRCFHSPNRKAAERPVFLLPSGRCCPAHEAAREGSIRPVFYSCRSASGACHLR